MIVKLSTVIIIISIRVIIRLIKNTRRYGHIPNNRWSFAFVSHDNADLQDNRDP